VAKLGVTEDDTLLVVLNDHGEEFFEHGSVGHGHSLYEEMIRAPLLVRYPKVFPAGGRVQHVVEVVDVFPTVLDVLGVPRPPGLEGVSLVEALGPRPPQAPSYAICEYLDSWRAVRTGRWKYESSQSYASRLFDLELDPDERADVSGARPVAEWLVQVLLAEGLATRAKWRRLAGAGEEREVRAEETEVDGELKRQLEALGYTP